MFLIDSANKKMTSIAKKTFVELGFSERKDLQEWICDIPEILGEPLLIIQKEFAGFSDTNERLDLLALDASGNLVIIENKLDDSGRDVVWQALKYVSYCALLKKSEICEIFQKHLGNTAFASEKICEFLGDDDFESIKLNSGEQRIILVAANFRKEVTATVLYLNAHQLDIKCIKVTPYQERDRIYLDAKQILPVQDAGDYQVRLSAKKQDEAVTTRADSVTRNLRREFWEKAIPVVAEKVLAFRGRSVSADHWLTGSSGHSGIGFNLQILKNNARVELYIDTGDKDKNKNIFDYLFAQRDAIEATFGTAIEWCKLPEKRASRLFASFDDCTLADKETWGDGIAWLAENMEKFYNAFKKPLDDAMKELK